MRAALISPYYLSAAAAADRPGRRSVGGVRLNVSQHMMTPDWRCFTSTESTLAEDGGSKLWFFCEWLKVFLQNVSCSWDGQPSMVLSGRFSGVSGGMKAIRLILKVLSECFECLRKTTPRPRLELIEFMFMVYFAEPVSLCVLQWSF